MGGDALPPWSELVSLGAAAAVAALAVSSTGSMVVAAVLFGVANRSRWSGLTAVLVTAAVAVRFATVGFDDLAGIQSVLGPAGLVGPPAAAASSWAAGAAILVAGRGVAPAASVPAGRVLVPRGLAALAGGALAAAIVAGPGTDDLLVRLAATVIGIGLALGVVAVTDRRPAFGRVRPALALAVAAVAVALASWPT